MSILVFALLVILVLALALWIVAILPLPAEPPYIKQILMAVLLLLAIIVIVQRAGLLAF